MLSKESLAEDKDFLDVRSSRQRTVFAAKHLIHLAAGNPAIHDVEWEALVALPPWCFWEVCKQEQLQIVAGAVSILPAIQMSTKSEVLRKVRDCVGTTEFEYLLHMDTSDWPSISVELGADVERTLWIKGEDVLSGVLDSEALRQLVLGAKGERYDGLSSVVSHRFCQRALDILELCHGVGIAGNVEGTLKQAIQTDRPGGGSISEGLD